MIQMMKSVAKLDIQYMLNNMKGCMHKQLALLCKTTQNATVAYEAQI
jgi:hypothetical protein